MPPQRTTTSKAMTSLLVLSVLCSCTLRSVHGQTNNTVDEATGAILWGDLAPDKPYKTADYVADDGGLDPYYALGKSFIDSSLPELLPTDSVKGIIEGDKQIGDEWQGLATDFIGFAICLVIGLLFIIIFPIVGLCFCCCRCCGNCGGKMEQKQGDNDRCKRIAFSIALAILALFVIAGAACTFVTSDQFSNNLGGLNDSFGDAIDDFNTFVDNIDNQFTRIGDTNFNFMKNVLTDYVANASSEVSERVITAVNKVVGLQAPLDELSALSGAALTKVDQLDAQVTTLKSQRIQAVTDLTTIHNQCNCLTAEITALNNLDFSPMETAIADFRTKVSTDVFGTMRDKIDGEIKTEVEKGTAGIDVAAKMDDIYNNQIKGLLDQIDTFKTSLNSDVAKYQDQVGDIVDVVEPYDQYRWYAGLGLAVFLLLIGLLMLLGVVLGCLCGSSDVRPTERGAGSNCGGICLMSAVGLIFIFGALLMLLTTLMYVFGSLTERYVCQSIDHLDRVEKYTSSFDLGIDLANISFNVNGDVIHTSASQLMSDCEQGKTIYAALNLQGVVDKALKEIRDYKDNLNITDSINTNDAANAISGIDVDSEIQALNETVDAIADVKTKIDDMKTLLEGQKTSAEGQKQGAGAEYDDMLTTLGQMQTTTGELDTTANEIKTTAGTLPALIDNAETRLKDPTVMDGVIKDATQAFVDTIFGFVDSYVNDIQEKLQNDVGKCTPVYSITNAILGEAFCHGIVDPLNGFWLALGWCLFFFMPSLILAVKLAKHFRRMKYEDSYGSTLDDGKNPPYYIEPSAPPPNHIIPNNKVAPF